MSYIGQAQTSNVLRTVTKLTATAGQTVFPVYGGYALGFVDVYLNGILLLETTDYSATDGANITLVAAAALNDEVTVIAYTPTTQIANKAEIRQTFVATGGQVNFPVTGGYNPGMISVYLNGVKLVNGTDVTVSSGTNVVFGSGLTSGDIVDVVGLVSFAVADAVRKTGDTVTGNLTINGNTGFGAAPLAGYGKAQIRNGYAYVNEDGVDTRQLYLRTNYAGAPAIQVATNDPLVIATNNTERMRIDASGRVTMPYQIAFYVKPSTNAQTEKSGQIFTWTNAILNVGSGYNSSNGRFTAPVSGTYVITANVMANAGTGRFQTVIQKNGSWVCSGGGSSTDYIHSNPAAVIYLAAGDYVQHYHNIGTAYGSADEHAFSGYLLG